MPPTNHETELNGIKAVKAFECNAGRSIQERKHKCGYDLYTKSSDGTDERHIEIKTTDKTAFTRRWLEPLEQKTLEEDEKFFLYLVINANAAPQVFTYNKASLSELYDNSETFYWYKFPKSHFLLTDKQ